MLKMSSICIHSRSRFGHGHSRSSSEPSVWPNVSTMTNGALTVEKLSPSCRMPWTLQQAHCLYHCGCLTNERDTHLSTSPSTETNSRTAAETIDHSPNVLHGHGCKQESKG